jgi:hypothetical protein
MVTVLNAKGRGRLAAIASIVEYSADSPLEAYVSRGDSEPPGMRGLKISNRFISGWRQDPVDGRKAFDLNSEGMVHVNTHGYRNFG